jgi:hypothetical protein
MATTGSILAATATAPLPDWARLTSRISRRPCVLVLHTTWHTSYGRFIRPFFLESVLERVFDSDTGTILSCLPGRLGLFSSEDEKLTVTAGTDHSLGLSVLFNMGLIPLSSPLSF